MDLRQIQLSLEQIPVGIQRFEPRSAARIGPGYPVAYEACDWPKDRRQRVVTNGGSRGAGRPQDAARISAIVRHVPYCRLASSD